MFRVRRVPGYESGVKRVYQSITEDHKEFRVCVESIRKRSIRISVTVINPVPGYERCHYPLRPQIECQGMRGATIP